MKKDSAEREQAWVGDAILSLYARSRILAEGKGMDQEKLQAMTCNQFLSCLGNPTSVEAEIGRIYWESGLQAALDHIEAKLTPIFEKQWKKRTVPRR